MVLILVIFSKATLAIQGHIGVFAEKTYDVMIMGESHITQDMIEEAFFVVPSLVFSG